MAADGSKGIDPMEQAMDSLLAEIVRDGFSEDDVELAKNTIISASIYERDNVARLARRVGAGLAVGLNVQEITGWTDEINKVTLSDINSALRRVLNLQQSVTGLLLPATD
jgi:zinc protease